jgi:pyruvate formate lyase activating enzyme
MRVLQCSAADVIPFSWVDGPGNRFVLFMQGCNFNCLACHNPHTIPLTTPRATTLDLEQVLQQVRDAMPYISGVTVSGGEATVQHEFVREFFAAIKAAPDLAHLSTLIDSNGHATEQVWDQLAGVTDGVMVDLKALNDEQHWYLTDETNALVLRSIKHLYSRGMLHEVRLLLIPGENDSDSQLADIAAWLLTVGPDIQIRLNAYNSHGVRAAVAQSWPDATPEDSVRWRSILARHGINHVV